MKQTSIEWLYDQIEYHGKCIYEVIEQARAMEKEQIIEAWNGLRIKNRFNVFYTLLAVVRI